MTGKLKNLGQSIDFQSYVDAVKTESITWEFFVQLMEDLCITKRRQKMFISILLQEFKKFIDKEKQSTQFQVEDENYHKEKSRRISPKNLAKFKNDSISRKNFFENVDEDENHDEKFRTSMIQIEEGKSNDQVLFHIGSSPKKTREIR